MRSWPALLQTALNLLNYILLCGIAAPPGTDG